jgi:hypothetical protein
VEKGRVSPQGWKCPWSNPLNCRISGLMAASAGIRGMSLGRAMQQGYIEKTTN